MRQQKGYMLRRFFAEPISILDEPIEKLLTEMNTYSPDTEEYRAAIEYMERLVRLKAEERRTRVSPDTMAIVVGNLLGILIIVAYEQKHVMVSKGMGLILKTK
jgi:hypothetical protein